MSSDPELWELLGNPLVSGGTAVSPAKEGCTVGAVWRGMGEGADLRECPSYSNSPWFRGLPLVR